MSVLSSEGNHARFPLSANHVAELLGNSSWRRVELAKPDETTPRTGVEVASVEERQGTRTYNAWFAQRFHG
jgi:hypothetical protein